MANEVKRKVTFSPTPSPLEGEGRVRGVGVIGLGKIGMQIARRLHRKGFKVLAWNRSAEPREKLEKFFENYTPPSIPPTRGGKKKKEKFPPPRWGRKGGGEKSTTVNSIAELVKRLKPPRIIWLLLPSGEIVEEHIQQLIPLLKPGDIIIDGGNSYYQDSIRRAKKLARHKINFLDCGTSGGVWGERNGFSLMVGGDRKIFKKLEPMFQALAAPSPNPSHPPEAERGNKKGNSLPPSGEGKEGGYSYGLVGPSGTGHFVKMVHNGIEYGMMEAIAEGFAVLKAANFQLDLARIAKIWEKGSVVSSWLITLARDIFEKENLNQISGYIHHTGEGEWTITTAKKLGVDVRVIEDAFKVRLESARKKNQNKFSNKIVALLRNRFGGHEVKRK